MARSRKCGCLTLSVVFINISLLIIAIFTFAFIREEIAEDWKYYPRKPFVSNIPYEYVFGLGISCILVGLTHTLLWSIAECIDSTILMRVSISIGIVKEIVSTHFRPYLKTDYNGYNGCERM